MPKESEQGEWSRDMAGYSDIMDASLVKIKKSEAIENLHQFFLHHPKNSTDFRQLLGFAKRVLKTLSPLEIIKIYMAHRRQEKHPF